MLDRLTSGCDDKGRAFRVVLFASMLLMPMIGTAQERSRDSVLAISEVVVSLPGYLLIIQALLVIVVLGGLAAYVLYKHEQLARARSEQMRLSGMLINAQEEERRRVAAELHDDFSQRLALLSLGLETAAEDAPRHTQEQLHELLNAASEIGADLHTLSHRLHSATLERLGLVPAVSSLCKEFTAQQGMPVAFSHNEVPRSVASDVALCLFRVVQESLRNAKKHSGASQAEVELNCNDGHLHLSVSDDGIGFDVSRLAQNQGLGILSMEERARLIGARLAICSEPQTGTRIDVWAPFHANGHGAEAYEPEARQETSISSGGHR
jgi:signal transduction histidine kinase